MVELMRQMDEEVIESIESLIGKSDQLARKKNEDYSHKNPIARR